MDDTQLFRPRLTVSVRLITRAPLYLVSLIELEMQRGSDRDSPPSTKGTDRAHVRWIHKFVSWLSPQHMDVEINYTGFVKKRRPCKHF
jgi:hypothetical protein